MRIDDLVVTIDGAVARVDVFKPIWDTKILPRFEKVSTQQMIVDDLLVEVDGGTVRVDVFIPAWDTKLLPQMLKTSAKHLGGKTPAVQGAAKQGQTRQGVKIPLFDELVRVYEASG